MTRLNPNNLFPAGFILPVVDGDSLMSAGTGYQTQRHFLDTTEKQFNSHYSYSATTIFTLPISITPLPQCKILLPRMFLPKPQQPLNLRIRQRRLKLL